MNNVYVALVRHAEYKQIPDVPSAHQPYALTPNGLVQAQQAGQKIKKMLEDQDWVIQPEIDSSSLLRAWQTAKIIADCLYLQAGQHVLVNSYSDLTERSMGSAANLTLKEIEDILRADPRFSTPPWGWKSDSHYCLPLEGAESLLQAGRRVANHITEQVTAMSQNPKLPENSLRVFVGHGAAIRHAAYYLGLLSLESMPHISMYHAEPIYLQYVPKRGWRHIAGNWKQREPKEVSMD